MKEKLARTGYADGFSEGRDDIPGVGFYEAKSSTRSAKWLSVMQRLVEIREWMGLARIEAALFERVFLQDANVGREARRSGRPEMGRPQPRAGI